MKNKKTSKQHKIGIAFGGGGARGFAHIGILQVLEEEGIEVSCISGTSMGSVMGALYALGVPLEKMAKAATGFGKKKFLSLRNINILNESLIKAKDPERVLDELVGDKTFEDCKIPFRAVAVDIESGEPVTLETGPLKPALMASSAIPFVFPPVFHEHRVLVDGGLVNNVPVGALKKCDADITIGVNINNFASKQEIAGDIFKHYYAPKYGNFFETSTFIDRTYRKMKDNTRMMFDIVMRAFEISTDAGTEMHLKENKPDLMLKPQIDIGILEFTKAGEAIELGRQCMTEGMPKLKELLDAF